MRYILECVWGSPVAITFSGDTVIIPYVKDVILCFIRLEDDIHLRCKTSVTYIVRGKEKNFISADYLGKPRHPYYASLVNIWCYGKCLLLEEVHPSIVEQRCSIAGREVKEIISNVRLYIYIVNLSAKTRSLPKQMVLPLTTDALPHTIHPRSDKQDTVEEPRLHSTTNTIGEWVDTTNVILLTPLDTL